MKQPKRNNAHRPRSEAQAIQHTVGACLTSADVEQLDRLAALEKAGRSTIVRKALRFYFESQATVTAA